jgi:23S rRNA pseudouridine1911/1915/1917 synthase
MAESYRFHVFAEAAGRRLDEFLASELGGISRMRIAGLIESGACTVSGIPSRAGHRLAAGESVEIIIEDPRPTAMTPDPLPLDIHYEDEHIIVVVKPAGMLVHPTMSVRRGTLANALVHHLNFKSQISGLKSIVRPGLPHRLDRATSGLMVVAKTPRALTSLSRHFHRRLVEKRYAAIVQGLVAEDEITIIAPIGRDPESIPRWRVMEGGRHAETRLRVLKRGERATFLEMEPVTGRTNQLRIHCAHRGHPILGDELYGRGQGSVDNYSSDKESPTPGPCSRLCLHAWRLAFHHPAGGRWMEFSSSLPDELARALADDTF